jgi:phage tail protein X
MGDVQRALGEGEAARASYERSLAIRERLAAAEPGRAEYQRDLSVSFDKLARLAEEEKAFEDALRYQRRDLGIAEHLWAAEPGRADLAQDLAISLLGTARLDPGESGALVRRAVQILQPLAAEGRLDVQGTRLLELALRLELTLGGDES